MHTYTYTYMHTNSHTRIYKGHNSDRLTIITKVLSKLPPYNSLLYEYIYTTSMPFEGLECEYSALNTDLTKMYVYI